jgi:hypothetical protein
MRGARYVRLIPWTLQSGPDHNCALYSPQWSCFGHWGVKLQILKSMSQTFRDIHSGNGLSAA